MLLPAIALGFAACGDEGRPQTLRLVYPSVAMERAARRLRLRVWPRESVACEAATAPAAVELELPVDGAPALPEIAAGGATFEIVAWNAADERFLAGCTSVVLDARRAGAVVVPLAESRGECASGGLRACFDGPAGTSGAGACAAGWTACHRGALLACQGQRLPLPERCNGHDDDCDGSADDSATCARAGCASPCGRSSDCCGGACVDVEASPLHCGACDHACGEGDRCCGGACVDPTSARGHCGACGRACAPGASCCDGRCADLTSDANSCGACGLACAPGESCCAGRCQPAEACTCSPSTCPDGCCDGGRCRTGVERGACGVGGAACQTCADDSACLGGACTACGCLELSPGAPTGCAPAPLALASCRGDGDVCVHCADGERCGAGACAPARDAEAPCSDAVELAWRRVSGTEPPPRTAFALAYDAARARVVLHGGVGRDAAGTSVILGDTWTWDGAWRQEQAAGPPRAGHALAFDAARGQVVLFGGRGPEGLRTDTWLWDGARWSFVTPPERPSPRSSHALAYDAARGQVLLFGGQKDTAILNDTWTWDGAAWTQHFPPEADLPPGVTGLVDHAGRGVVVLVWAGADTDYWLWDGARWTRRHRDDGGLAGAGEAMAYDAGRCGLLLWDGRRDGEAGLLHPGGHAQRWNDSWADLAPSGDPPGAGGRMALHAGRGALLLFGGQDAAGLASGTWVSER